MHDHFFCGLSGIAIPFVKKDFPAAFQDKSRLEYYASLFNSLEVNSSFYKLPLAATVAKWADAVPENFRFTFKISKDITHAKGLKFNHTDIKKFIDVIKPAAQKKGCILIQFPPSITIDHLNTLQDLLGELQYHNTEHWQAAVEFRHNSWYEKETVEILEEYQACMVVHDLPASATPPEYIAGKTLYFRFHGPAGGYRGSYNNDQLKKYALLIKQHGKRKDAYCYFNNTMGEAFDNAQTLAALIKKT